MAKKDKDTIFKEYLAELVELKPELKDLLADEKVSAKLKDGVLARAEFSSQMDTLKSERADFEKEVAEARTKISGWQKWYGEASQEVAKVQDQLKQYRDTYGELEASDQKKIAREAGLSVEEYKRMMDEKIRERDLVNLKFADDLTDIKIDYKERFKEKLPTDEIYKIAGEKGMSLTQAYDTFIKDRVAEQDKAKYDEALKRAREEGAAEALAKHNLPVVPSSSDLVHVIDAKDVPASSRDRVAAATSAFNSAFGRRQS